MNLQEKMLYHQIHPAKLATDFGVTFSACYFFWRHQIAAAIGISLATRGNSADEGHSQILLRFKSSGQIV